MEKTVKENFDGRAEHNRAEPLPPFWNKPIVPLGALFMASLAAFDVVLFLGYIWPYWMRNGLCFAYLGCNNGFFGFDAFPNHYTSGALQASTVLWLSHAVPRFNLFRRGFLKNALLVVAIVALIGVLWEISEFSHDRYNILIAHQDLSGTDKLMQPSNSDTMGDLTFGLLGGTTMALLVRLLHPKRLYDPSLPDEPIPAPNKISV